MAAPTTANGVVVMGEVVAPFGIRGWVKVRPHTGEPAALLGYPVWSVQSPQGGEWHEMTLLSGRLHAGMLIAQLAGVTCREAAVALKGFAVGVWRSAMPAARPGEIYWADLVGMTVVNRAGVLLGKVIAVTEHGAHPLLRVARPEESARTERLIPYVPTIVLRVDAPAGRIEVDWGEDY
jgi:16S rRNA processing protein RimM